MNRAETEGHQYSVGEICAITGVTRKTLFYYDRIGLLKPSSRRGSQEHKRYGNKELERLKTILEYRDAGLSVSETGKMIDDPDCDKHRLLEKVLERLEKEREEKESQIIKVKEYLCHFV